MSEFQFNMAAYLDRLQLKRAGKPDIECLKHIHRAQHCHIPFENFDIVLGKNIDLAPPAIFNKLVQRNRGGYCFELNQLLLMALQHLGFEARALLARVQLREPPSGRGHQISLVTIDQQQWIVDAGFGSQTPCEPLPLVLGKELRVKDQCLKFTEHPDYGIMLCAKKEGQWSPLYSFDFTVVCQGDIDYGNHYTSSHPNSTFTQSRVAAIATEHGMCTLLDDMLTEYIGDQKHQHQLAQGAQYITALEQYFLIELDESERDFLF